VYTLVYTRVHYPEHTECLVGLSLSRRLGKSLGRWYSECTASRIAKYMGAGVLGMGSVERVERVVWGD